jgi:Kdo2-lipid IVA lauroyltransferase/acyltransferase
MAQRVKKRKRLQHFVHYFEYTLLKSISLVLKVMPEKWFYSFTRLLALFVFYVVRLRRQTTISNLSNAFGDKYNEKELKKIARNSYINIGMTFFELFRVAGNKDLVRKMVDVGDISVVRQALMKGRGVIAITCHHGSWELLGASIASYGIPCMTIAKRQVNPFVDTMVNRYRQDAGMNVVYSGASVKHLINALKRGETVGLISDQDVGRTGVFVTFFGRKASTPRGAAQLAIKYGATPIVIDSVRTSFGKYRNIYREVDVYDNDTVESLTQRFTTIMENFICQNPDQYFWMHRRWKTRPLENVSGGQRTSEEHLITEISQVEG